ncbi:hypothetical protein EDC01DRAFT_743152 [Geopyxis carbonaria]|nr:hypothetical protein EDC01DRAFT_743152 [Geopyxis carbonaria]
MPHKERFGMDSNHLFQIRYASDTGVWKDAPVLIGSTRFDPLNDTKNILVTGGEGFVACWLVRHLTLTYSDCYNIVSFDRLDYCSSLNNTAPLDRLSNFTFVHGDITRPDDVKAVLKKYDIDTIFHFAAQSHVDNSFGNSYEFTAVNTLGTHVLLECARHHPSLRRFIHISTDEVYGEVPEGSLDLIEETPLAPTNPYSASKAAAEMMIHAYWKSFKLPIIVVRSNNIYGPHQFPEKIIPKFTCLLERGKKLTLHGDGKHQRRYLFAGDSVDAFDTILHRGSIGEIYNMGSSDELSNAQLCDLILKEFGVDPPQNISAFVDHTVDRPFNDRRYAVDDKKLRHLGWEQKTKFEEGLKITVEWYRRFGETWWGNIDNALLAHSSQRNLETIVSLRNNGKL